jgi:hypothetical protein
MKLLLRLVVILAIIAGAIELFWFRQLRQISNSSNRPLEFYGICLDQDDNPVADVQVTMGIRRNEKMWPLGIRDVFKDPTLVTGRDGRFILRGETGAMLRVKSTNKSGYEASQKSLNRSFWYWSDPRTVHHPDEQHPVVYRLWKQAGAERLIDKGCHGPIPWDNTPTEFDLIEGRSVAVGGDWRVRLLRNPVTIRYGQTHFEWTVTIEALNGGLIQSDAEQMYYAPAIGYQPTLVVHMPADDSRWTDQKDIEVYFKIRGTLFGRATVKMMVGSDRPQGTPFSIKAFINPSGSQNLEYDSLQAVAGWKPPNSGGAGGNR